MPVQMNNLEFSAALDHPRLAEDNRARHIPTLDDWTGAIQELHRREDRLVQRAHFVGLIVGLMEDRLTPEDHHADTQ